MCVTPPGRSCASVDPLVFSTKRLGGTYGEAAARISKCGCFYRLPHTCTDLLRQARADRSYLSRKEFLWSRNTAFSNTAFSLDNDKGPELNSLIKRRVRKSEATLVSVTAP